jgi:dTDP-4-dehydrorhamnose 3,5-epimerase-like enzyme
MDNLAPFFERAKSDSFANTAISAIREQARIAWNDPDLKIYSGVTTPIISAKDAKFPTLAKAPAELLMRPPVK